MIVVDASAITELLLQTELGIRVEARSLADLDPLQAPSLLDVAVLQALRRLVQKGDLAPERGEQAVEDLLAVDQIRHQHTDLGGRIWELRENLTAYDAAYVALAEALDAPLITCDRPLASAPGHAARIELIR